MANLPFSYRPMAALRLGVLALPLLFTACGGGGGGTTAALVAPTITTQPASVSVAAGGSATFTVVATGNPAPSYQWTQGTTSVGTNLASYTIPVVAGAMNGETFTVTVTNSQGSVTSSPAAALTVTTSADQNLYEEFGLAPNNIYNLYWNLPVSGAPVAGTSYLAETHHTVTASPLTNGSQEGDNTALADLSSGLARPANTPVPDRFLVNNAIVVASGPAWVRKVTYLGGAIHVDLYDVAGTTIVDSYTVSNFSKVDLAGTIATVNASTAASAYPDLTRWFDEIFFNPAILTGTTSWTTGAAYMKYTQTQAGDLYFVFDYSVTQSNSGTTPTPVASGTTVAAYMVAHPLGVYSASDGTRYTLANMTATTVGTVPTWVATAVRPNRTTPCYWTLYELNGNIYCGEVVKTGTVLGGSSFHVGTPASNTIDYSLNYEIMLNQAAKDSIKAALAF
jgi:hypothetical protein